MKYVLVGLLPFCEYTAKGTAFSYLAFDFKLAVVAFEDVFDDGETEAGSALRAVTSAINTVEALGQSWNVFFGDAGAVILHFEDEIVVVFFPEDVDSAFGLGITDRVKD